MCDNDGKTNVEGIQGDRAATADEGCIGLAESKDHIPKCNIIVRVFVSILNNARDDTDDDAHTVVNSYFDGIRGTKDFLVRH